MLRRLAALLLLALCLQAQEPFFFIQASDPQFGMYTDNRDFAQETANFEFLIATANRLKPAFLVITGDLVNKAGDTAQTAEYLRIAARLDKSIPIHHVPGNHDVDNTPTPQSLAAYRAKFGPDYYTFRHGSAAFFVLDSTVIHSPAKVPGELDKQETWLRAELDKARREGVRHLVILQHHPWFLLSAGEPDQYFNVPQERRRRFLDLFGEFGVKHVFAGHYHANLVTQAGPLEMITTGPIGKPRSPAERSGLRVIIVRDTGLEHTYYDLGSIPNQIVLR